MICNICYADLHSETSYLRMNYKYKMDFCFLNLIFYFNIGNSLNIFYERRRIYWIIYKSFGETYLEQYFFTGMCIPLMQGSYLVKCQFGFSKFKEGPKNLHFCGAPRGC